MWLCNAEKKEKMKEFLEKKEFNNINKQNAKYSIVDYLFACFFAISIFNESLTLLFLSAYILFVTFLFISNTRIYFIKINPYFVFSLLFIVVCYILHLNGNSIYPSASQNMLDRLFKKFLLMILVYYYFYTTKNINHIFDVIALSVVFFTIIVFILCLPTLFKVRLGDSIGVNSNALAYNACIAAAFIYSRNLKSKKFADKLLLVFLFITVLFTGSRKGIFFFTFIIIFMFIFTKKSKKIALYLIIALLLIGLMYMLIIKVPVFYNLIGYRVENIINLMKTGETDEASLLTRTNMIEVAWEKIEKNPLTGYGLDSFRNWNPNKIYSHNNYIELLFSVGVIGIIFWYLPYLWIMLNCLYLIKKDRNDYTLIMILGLVICILILDYGLVSYYANYVLILQLLMFTYISKKKVAIL